MGRQSPQKHWIHSVRYWIAPSLKYWNTYRQKKYEQDSCCIQGNMPCIFYLTFDSKNFRRSAFSRLRNSSVHSLIFSMNFSFSICSHGFSVSAMPYMRASMTAVSKYFLSMPYQFLSYIRYIVSVLPCSGTAFTSCYYLPPILYHAPPSLQICTRTLYRTASWSICHLAPVLKFITLANILPCLSIPFLHGSHPHLHPQRQLIISFTGTGMVTGYK